MRRRFSFFNEGSGKKKKDDSLRAWLSQRKLNDKEIINLLEQTLRQTQNIKLIKRYAKKAGLRLRSFQTNDKLELYYDICQKGKSVCYISRGWGDPGFRLGAVVALRKGDSGCKDTFCKIFKICSKQLISVGVIEKREPMVNMSLEIGIYQEGLNEKVLKEAVRTMESAVKEIKAIDRQ